MVARFEVWARLLKAVFHCNLVHMRHPLPRYYAVIRGRQPSVGTAEGEWVKAARTQPSCAESDRSFQLFSLITVRGKVVGDAPPAECSSARRRGGSQRGVTQSQRPSSDVLPFGGGDRVITRPQGGEAALLVLCSLKIRAGHSPSRRAIYASSLCLTLLSALL